MIATAQSMSEKRKEDEANASAVARGNLVIISGCSGVGKSTMIRRLLKEYPEALGFSVSSTTRAPRSAEVDGVDYNFVTREEFKDKVDRGEFLEWAEVHGNLYGTTKDAVEKIIGSGRTCVLDLDIQGVRMMSEKQIAGALYIWVAPPDMDILEGRLRERGTEDEEILNTRLADALKEMTFAATTETFDHTIVNDSLEGAYEKLKSIVQPVMV
uniref:guanylate kinase n=1 Tax=Rhodosorus marinus TaxID=101924 RepID=A0A7S0BMC8_9RHOD|mmetsp:Transcript_23205/g.33281  ORF Transcript_23205/g.33281 Transcript_23205/m.33281 type:complete len:213 (+) Transcript_23205:407-1045(+)